MIFYTEAGLECLSIHHAGNTAAGGTLQLSRNTVDLKDEVLKGLLMQFFVGAFSKVHELYQFDHPSGDLYLNEVYHYASQLFKGPEQFHVQTELIAKHLFRISKHPNIKPGELYVTFFRNLQVDGALSDAIGIFKSESKEPYLTVFREESQFNIAYEQEAINIKKLDKGCLIFQSEQEKGFKVAVIDQTNRTEAAYWTDEFLQLKIRNDQYTQTQHTLQVYKSFITEGIGDDVNVTNTDKIDLLNRSIRYFKDKEQFDLNEFSNEVIANPQGIEMFQKYKKDYEADHDMPVPDSFAINPAAVKKQARLFKSVLKLDKNFHIYIHGDKELIEQGFDQEKNMNYYKVFYKEEH